MRLHFRRPHKSLQELLPDGDYADFIILTGENGSGKSQLLEAIEVGAVGVDELPDPPGAMVRRFVLSQLVAQVEGPASLASFRDSWIHLKNFVDNQLANLGANSGITPDQVDSTLRSIVLGNRLLTKQALDRIEREADKPLARFDNSDYRLYAPLLQGVKDPFAYSLNELFLSYHGRRFRNQVAQFQQATYGRTDGIVLTNGDFEARYGPEPWELMNEALRAVGLRYAFVGPDGPEEQLPYNAILRENENPDIEVLPQDLSSGEKTLLAVAMSLYTGTRMGEAIELPYILLLDETDASLHPSMARNLLEVVQTVFVERYGVKVIMTTHSPTTVALAPEESLYVMRRHLLPRIARTFSVDQALSSLVVGLPTLSVRFQNRRLVFVESEYDEDCYQEAYRLLRAQLGGEVSLQFVASGRGGQGNSEAVKYLVRKMREAGNDLVFGLLDRDQRERTSAGVEFDAERYSLENYAFDPAILCVFLLRERVVDPVALGLDAGDRHFMIDGPRLQVAIDRLTGLVAREGGDLETVSVSYVDGSLFSVPSFWLNARGHDLEQQLKTVFPALNRFRPSLPVAIFKLGYGDRPGLFPTSLMKVFQRLQS